METAGGGLGWSLTFCISNKLPGVADAAGPGSPPSASLFCFPLWLLLLLLGLHPRISAISSWKGVNSQKTEKSH